MKKVTIYIDNEGSWYSKEIHNEWNNKFVLHIIDTELDGMSGFGYVLGYTIEDITKQKE